MSNSSLSDIDLYKQMLETSQDSCWSVSLPSFRLEYANKESTEKLLGYPVERYYEDPSFWFSIVYEEDRKIAQAANEACLKNGFCETKYRLVHKSGKAIWILARLRLIKDDKGQPIRLIGSSMDINEATIKEQKLKESEELFHSLANFALIGIYITDVDGKCLYTNRHWQEVAGLTLEESLGDGWKEGIHPDDREKVFSEWHKATQECRNYHGQFRFKGHLGIRIVDSRAAPILDNGKIIAFVGTFEDITDKLKSERTLNIQRERLVASAKMSSLGEMASGIAHEINNPLMIIVGLCTRIRRQMQDTVDLPLLKSEVEKIENTTFRISKIIKGLRNFSRNSDKDPMEKITISRLIEDTLELCSQRFRDNGINLNIDTGNSSELEVEARPSQLTQVMLNLLSNAFDAVEMLDEKWVRIEVKENRQKVIISVTDSGNGVPREVQEKMMDPFFTTKEVGKGTGLGLSISKGILEEHHGRLIYDSGSARTCFNVELRKIL